MKKYLLFLVLLFGSLSILAAQNRTVKGTVVSSKDGQPVISASITVKNHPTTGCTTDLDGHFSMEVPADAKTLVVRYVGMITQEVAITPGEMLIKLEEDTQMLDAVVVTGYSTTAKKAFTGASSSISSEKVKAKFDANPINALKGNVPGLIMTNVSGQPGAPTTIFVRGRNSLNSGTQPLYVIDGVPMETASNLGSRSNEGQEVSPLAALNSDDIASINLLRDATATSIYGARAANGVIVITTKRGASGFKMNFSSRFGFSTLPVTSGSRRYKLADAKTYAMLSQEAVMNGIKYAKDLKVRDFFTAYADLHELPQTPEGALDFLEWFTGIPNLKEGEAGTNWLAEVTRKGFLQDYTLDLSGGGSSPLAPRYFLSFNHMKENGIVIGKGLTRYSVRINLDQAPFSFFKYGLNSSSSLTEISMGAGGGYFSDPITQAYMQSPFSPIRNADGTYNFNTVNGYNPVAQRDKDRGDKDISKQYRVLFSPYATITFLDWLSFTSRVGIDVMLLDQFGYWSFMQPQGKDMNGHGENTNAINYYLSISNIFNVNKTWGDHQLNALLGQEGQRMFYKKAYLEASNYPVDYLNDVILASVPSTTFTYRNELKLLSFFANAEYSYAQRYFFSTSLRADASSRFSAKNRWGVFYSLGAKWNIANEEFFEGAKNYVQDLSLRSSWGTTGNQVVGSGWYASLGFYDYGYIYNQRPGKIMFQLDAPDLKWEQTRKFNVGLDARFFDLLRLSFDYYNHRTTDMVFAVPLSPESGIPTIYGAQYYQNIGVLQNQGIEFELGVDALRTEDLSLSFSFTGSANQNKILKLATDQPINSTLTTIRPGHDIYTWYMKEWAGVDPQTGRGTWYKNTPGAEREITFNVAEAAQKILGKASPDFIGGFRTDFKYKDFDFSMLWNYALGGKIYGNHLRYDENGGGSFGNNYTQWVADNRWKEPGDNALVPMVIDASTPWNTSSSRYLMNGNYLKLQNLMFGYTLKIDQFKTIGLNSVRFFVSMDNVYTFVAKDYRGFDPASVGHNGNQWWNYPQSFKFTGGVTLSF